MHEPAINDESVFEGEAEGGRCPVPEWALRPLAFALPVIAAIVFVWFLFLR